MSLIADYQNGTFEVAGVGLVSLVENIRGKNLTFAIIRDEAGNNLPEGFIQFAYSMMNQSDSYYRDLTEASF